MSSSVRLWNVCFFLLDLFKIEIFSFAAVSLSR